MDRNEAIAVIKYNWPYGCQQLKEALETIMPKLKESEDERERIRKEILEYFQQFDNEELREVNISDWIAWLEKQGEQKAVKFDNTNVKRMFIKALERVEEQNNKGYKLTDCDKNSWWEDFKAYCGYTEMQKPAWSEEDERLCQCLIRDQERGLEEVRNDKYGHSEIISDLKEMYRERIDWLKSIKEKMKGE